MGAGGAACGSNVSRAAKETRSGAISLSAAHRSSYGYAGARRVRQSGTTCGDDLLHVSAFRRCLPVFAVCTCQFVCGGFAAAVGRNGEGDFARRGVCGRVRRAGERSGGGGWEVWTKERGRGRGVGV